MGFTEAKTAEEVEAALAQPGTTMIAVNAICDVAAAKMRPAMKMALQNASCLPDRRITVFAGQDLEATACARSHFEGNPASSPAVAILRGGKLVYLLQRDPIDAASAQEVAEEFKRAMAEFCASKA
jgi:putative YphP/YqiW family bacilliredoxin